MKDRFQNPAIRNSIVTVFVLFSVALFINYLLTSHFFSEIEEGQYLVNIAGKNRTLSQRMLIESQRIAEGNENLKVTLNELIIEHSIILKALENGGDVNIDGQETHISHSAEGDLLNVIERARKFWNESYKKPAEEIVTAQLYVTKKKEEKNNNTDDLTDFGLEQLAEIDVVGERVINPAIVAALAKIEKNSSNMLLLNDQLVEAYLKELDDRRKNADNLVLLLTIGNILFLVLGYLLIRRVVLNPLFTISKAAEEISEGDLSQQIDYERNNEVGAVSKALNRMVNSLQNATSFIQNIGSGNLDVHYKGIIDEDDVDKSTLAGALLEMRERMRNVAQEENQRKWATEGLGLFVDILRENNNDIRKLSYEIVSNIVKYIDALQGGLYIVNDDDERHIYAEMLACYAFGKQKFLKQKIKAGEGVVGQVLLEGDRVYITDVPDDYADINSGMGSAKPRTVLIIPLKLNDQLLGMIELASFHQIYPYQVEFLERLANNIASTLANARVSEKTKSLLAEQQTITQEMRVKEEELLQNMEELQATQEEMKKNEEALFAQSYAISTTLISAEYDMEGRLLKANEQFLANFKHDISDIKGKHHRSFLDTESAYSDQYANFWEDLQAGKTQSGEYKRIAKGGAELWLRATYVPILDADGIPYKVICLAFDITDEKLQMLDFQSQVSSIRRSNVVLEFDLQGYITDANKGFSEASQYIPEEAIGQHFNFLLGKKEAEDDEYKLLWRKLKGGSYETGEYQFKNKIGESFWLQGSFNPIFDLNGNTLKIVFFASDTTRRKEVEMQIREAQRVYKIQQENLTALINNTDELILAVDKNFIVTTINDNAKTILKLMGREVDSGVNIIHTFPTTQYEILKKPYDKALKGEKVRVEEKYVGNKGEDILLLTTYNPIYDDSDKIQGVTVFAKDITEIKKNADQLLKVQKEMEETEADLRALINNTDDLIYSIDNHFQLLAFNDAFEEDMLQRMNVKIKVGTSVTQEVHTQEDKEFWKGLYARALSGEYIKLKANDSENIVKKNITMSTIKSNKDKVLGVAVFIKQQLN